MVSQSNKELETCRAELADSKERELRLLDKVQNLEKQVLDLQSCQTNQPDTKDDFYTVGSSILRDVSPHDKANTEAFKKSFSYSCPLLWNRLPNELKDTESLSSFKTMDFKYSESYFL